MTIEQKWFALEHNRRWHILTDDSPELKMYPLFHGSALLATVATEEVARLMAAAPERAVLLKALRHIAFEPLTDDSEASDGKCLREAVQIVRDAISKATDSA